MSTWMEFAMVFDWDKAARLIKEKKPEKAYAGLRDIRSGKERKQDDDSRENGYRNNGRLYRNDDCHAGEYMEIKRCCGGA